MKNPKSSIAVVGMACQYPDARSPSELWENVLSRRRAFRKLPPERLRGEDYFSEDRARPDSTYAARAAVIEGYEFDRAKFRVPPSTFGTVDLTHWLALDVASRALEDAGYPSGEGLPRDRTGVLVGNSLTGEFSRANVLRLRWPYVSRTVESALEERGLPPGERRALLEALEARYKSPFPETGDETLAGGLSNTIAGRICNHFDLHGGGYTVDGACASSLLAIANACSAIVAGDLDAALAGGVDLSLDPFELVGFAKIGVLASDDMRVYDARPTGFWPGEGCGMVLLMRLEEALARKLAIHATIEGWGVSSDGQGGLTRPELKGQLLAIRRAYERAGFGPHTVAIFEGHGTGTELGDATELRAISLALRESVGRPAAGVLPAAMGSIKANIGHTKAAAGVAGFLKAVLAVREEILPPITGLGEPHPELSATPAVLRVLQEAEPFTRPREPGGWPARAGVNSLGFGGINVHVVVEGRPEPQTRRSASRELRPRPSDQDAEIFLFDGADGADLRRRVETVANYAGRLSLAELGDLAARLQEDLGRGPRRAAVVASSPEELADLLEDLRLGLSQGESASQVPSACSACIDPGRGIFRCDEPKGSPRIGLLFPGQASPTYFDGGALARRFPSLRRIHALPGVPRGGDPAATEVAQPAIAAASILGLRALEHLGISPALAVGHSVGELAALHWAGVFDEAALLEIAAARGKLMATLGKPGGAMAGIKAPREEAEAVIAGDAAVVAGVNSPLQTVISGEAGAVERVLRRARSKGLQAVLLPVSHAFHSHFMDPVRPALAEFLAARPFAPPQRRVVSTIAGRTLRGSDDLKGLLATQLGSPVLFTAALAEADREIDLWIEAGPGRVLAKLAGEQVKGSAVSLDAGGPSLRGTLNAAGAAFVLGAEVRTAALFDDRFRRPFALQWRPRFFANPCELAPLSRSEAEEPSPKVSPPPPRRKASADPAPEPSIPASATPLEAVKLLVARRLDLPEDAIGENARLLGDLHLNSISVGEIMSQAARRLGLSPPRAPTEFAGATVGGLARALEEMARAGSSAARDGTPGLPAGVGEWVRAFEVAWEERPPPPPTQRPPGLWTVVAPPGHPFAEKLEAALAREGRGSGFVVCLPEEPDRLSLEILLDAARTAMRRCAASSSPETLFVLVHHGVGGAFAKTLRLECPALAVRAVEVPTGFREAIPWIVREASAAGGFQEARYDRSGRRTEPFLRSLPPSEPESLRLGEDDVVLVTGGGKGISAECALALGLDTGARLVLVGRSRPEADPELEANLSRMARAGARARYYAADVADPAALLAAVRRAEDEVGRVTAVIHGAGTNAPRLIESLDAAAFIDTLRPKIEGLRNLLAAVDVEGLKLLVTFSSIIGRIGLPGEADYALANEWLSSLTERFRAQHPGCRCLALEWSVWSGVGMGERLGRVERLLAEGISPITPDRGVSVFKEILPRPLPSAAVVVSGRFGTPPTLRLARRGLPVLRFLELPRVHYPAVELVVDCRLSSQSDPYLRDHELGGQRLFPAVFLLEAMAQATQALLGEEALPVFEDVTFQRAVVVPREGSRTIRIAALAQGPGIVELELRSDETEFLTDHAAAVCRIGSPQGEGAARAELPSAPASVASAAPRIALDPERDLYGRFLFHRGRFRRLTGYRTLAAKECAADIGPAESAEWFGWFVPGRLLLGDPGARDAAIHAIQACIPHGRLLPVGVERIRTGFLKPGRAYRVEARERSRSGDLFVYDMAIVGEDGSALESWEGLRLKKVEAIEAHKAWPRALLGPYLERRMEELFPGSGMQVALCLNGATGRDERAAAALRQAVRSELDAWRRPDGKPEAGPARSVSVAHSGDLTLAIAGWGALGCDLEAVANRPPEAWRDLLGSDRLRLAEVVVSEDGEDIDSAATRVWTALECLKKAGASPDAPLVLDSPSGDGWVLFKSGRLCTGTYLARLDPAEPPLVLALLGERHAKSL